MSAPSPSPEREADLSVARLLLSHSSLGPWGMENLNDILFKLYPELGEAT